MSVLPAPAGRRRRRGGSAGRRREAATAYVMIAPNLLLFGAFMFLPLLLVFNVAMQNKPTFGPAHYVGFANYTRLYHDPTFWRCVLNTVGYAIVMVPVSLAIGMVLAQILNRQIWFRGLLRSVYYVPVVISGLATGIITGWLFNENFGVVNRLSTAVGLGNYHWQSNPTLAVVTVLLVTIWSRIGFCMVIYLAALQGVDRQLYDAAAVDGASAWATFRNITLPGVRATTAFLVVYSVIEAFQIFDLVYALTGGGPGDTTNVLGLYAYQTAFQSRDRGYGAAIGVVLYLVLLTITALQLLITRRRREAR